MDGVPVSDSGVESLALFTKSRLVSRNVIIPIRHRSDIPVPGLRLFGPPLDSRRPEGLGGVRPA